MVIEQYASYKIERMGVIETWKFTPKDPKNAVKSIEYHA
jgi:hypothetical protein